MSKDNEINIQKIEELRSPYDRFGNGFIIDERTETINKLIKAVKQLDKRINNK